MSKSIKPLELTDTAGKKATKGTDDKHVIACRRCQTKYDKGAPSSPDDAMYLCDTCGADGHDA